MIQTRYLIRPTRRVRDLLRRQRFVATQRFPGGREILIATAETRNRALKAARNAARPNGSPTAGGGGTYTPGYEPGSDGSAGQDRDSGSSERDVIIQ